MKNLIILYFALALATALGSPSKEIKSRNLVVPAGRPEGRITRGNQALQNEFRYQVGLQIYINDTHYAKCGGSLLNHRLVLTAAHCTQDVRLGRVLLGTTNFENPEVEYNFTDKNIIIHSGYRNHRMHDISLIIIPYTDYTDKIQPVTLPDVARSYPTYSYEEVIASGWGLIGDSDEDTTNTLQWAKIFILPNEICGRRFRIRSSHICTIAGGSVSVCKGDSGGPLVLSSTGVQIGIVSYGGVSCLENAPAVYTRVTSYLDWINAFASAIC